MEKLPNYMKDLIKVAPQATPGQVTDVVVRHDEWCMIWNGGRCNCEPQVSRTPNRAERRAAKKARQN